MIKENSVQKKLIDLLNLNIEKKNYKFYKNKKEKNDILKSEVGEFFRKVLIEDPFKATYEYISKKHYSILKIINYDGFYRELNDRSKNENAKLELERLISDKKNNYTTFSQEIRFPYKAINILLYNNSKEQSYIDNKRSYLIKSLSPFFINNKEVIVEKELFNTISYNFFSNEKLKLNFKGTIVLIENKESYDFADKIFDPRTHLFVLYGGNASDKEHDFITNNIYANNIIYFGDFDYVSLKEYNKLKKKIPNIEIYYGGNLKELENKFKLYSNKLLFINQEDNYEYILNNFDEISKLIWRIIQKYEGGLEQEIFHAPDL